MARGTRSLVSAAIARRGGSGAVPAALADELARIDAADDLHLSDLVAAALADPDMRVPRVHGGGRADDPSRGAGDLVQLALLSWAAGDRTRAAQLLERAQAHHAAHQAWLVDHTGRAGRRIEARISAHTASEIAELSALMERGDAAAHAALDVEAHRALRGASDRIELREAAAVPYLRAALNAGDRAGVMAIFTAARGLPRDATWAPVPEAEWEAARALLVAEAELEAEEQVTDVQRLVSFWWGTEAPHYAQRLLADARMELRGHAAPIRQSAAYVTLPTARTPAQATDLLRAVLRDPVHVLPGPSEPSAHQRAAVAADPEVVLEWARTAATRPGYAGLAVLGVPRTRLGGSQDLYLGATSVLAGEDGTLTECVVFAPLGVSRRTNPDSVLSAAREAIGDALAPDAPLDYVPKATLHAGLDRHPQGVITAPAPAGDEQEILGTERCRHAHGQWRLVGVRTARRELTPAGAALDCPECRRTGAGWASWEQIPPAGRQRLRRGHDPLLRSAELADDDPARMLRIARYRARVLGESPPASLADIDHDALNPSRYAVGLRTDGVAATPARSLRERMFGS